ncbi:MAG: phosphoribosylformylglycinamidine synthase subunit PurL [bacterium]
MTRDEYEKVRKLLGREPNALELGIIGSLWSEHCSYKSSKTHLKLFPTKAPWVIQGPGENAGAVDVGEGWVAAFKIESHNHPSAIEPYQGAATGIGGIVRDILALGARPVALLDSLRFGPVADGGSGRRDAGARNRYLFKGVVAGIADYGNCIGVPTVGGEIYFDDSYSGNPLVNVMCVGLCRRDKLQKGVARGEGNALVLIGALTGRDGIHGASGLASAELTVQSPDHRPAVQVGDPFREKCVIEAVLEIVEKVGVVGVQDLGAAGLSSAASEMAFKGGNGVELELTAVPQREPGMTPYEIMLSESQERMMVCIRKGDESSALAIARKWGLEAALIGRVVKGNSMKVSYNRKPVADLPVSILTSAAPVYDRPMKEPASLKKLHKFHPDDLPVPADIEETLVKVLGSPNIASRRPVYRQYDHMVQTNTVRRPGSDAAALRIKDSARGIAITTDGNGRYCALDPFEGGKLAVAEAARNLVAVGAKPIAITNCLNFGNPEDPEVMWAFRKVIEGITEAAKALDTPVVSGNVSFYNESPQGRVDSTPVVGMIGVIEDLAFYQEPGCKQVGDVIVMIGPMSVELGGSEYLKAAHGLKIGKPPRVDLKTEKKVLDTVRECVRQKLFRSVKDVSEGGIAAALIEDLAGCNYGAGILIPKTDRWDHFLFSEAPSRFLATIHPEQLTEVLDFMHFKEVPFLRMGSVFEERVLYLNAIEINLRRIVDAWKSALVF